MSGYFIKPIVKTLMLKGQAGQSIKEIKKTSTSGLIDTYEILLTDGTKKTFNVSNGKGIKVIAKTSTSGLLDTYTTTYNDGTTSTFTVSNGKGIKSIAKTATNGLVDTYTITYNDGTTSTFTVKNGAKGDIENLLDRTYPIGSIYMSVNSTEPSTLFGGTWKRLEGRFLIGAGTNLSINTNGEYGDLGHGDPDFKGGETGGEYWHQLSIDEMPEHTHGIKSNSTDGNGEWILQDHRSSAKLEDLNWQHSGRGISNTGGSQKHSNMPPYLAVYMWKRTA